LRRGGARPAPGAVRSPTRACLIRQTRHTTTSDGSDSRRHTSTCAELSPWGWQHVLGDVCRWAATWSSHRGSKWREEERWSTVYESRHCLCMIVRQRPQSVSYSHFTVHDSSPVSMVVCRRLLSPLLSNADELDRAKQPSSLITSGSISRFQVSQAGLVRSVRFSTVWQPRKSQTLVCSRFMFVHGRSQVLGSPQMLLAHLR
jgi:hypothetical protein